MIKTGPEKDVIFDDEH